MHAGNDGDQTPEAQLELKHQPVVRNLEDTAQNEHASLMKTRDEEYASQLKEKDASVNYELNVWHPTTRRRKKV
eukprot:4336656-Prorocentrum_lima.AAC.1